jgi:predicted phosphodiesterase
VRRFLLISDIHAADTDPSSSKAPSYVSSFRSPSRSPMDPIAELEELIRQEDLAPDCILCPGDITNKSQPAPFGYAWERLQQLSNKCGAKLIATVGNHDVDSRYKANSFDPRGFAMSLAPKIPTADRRHYLEYWAENFTLVSSEQCNILVLNTAAYHGAGKDAAAEIEHGRISDQTLSSISHELNLVSVAPVNILLCHHHLIKPETYDDELKGQTRGGEKLIQLLNQSDGAWIVIHGHKHVPDLFYSHGGSNSPVILGCASFSAQINEDAQNKNPNQVHLLICDPDGAKSAGLTSSGTILSWTWQPGVGWRKAVGLQGLPHFTGFGHRSSVDPLVAALDAHLTKTGSSVLDWPTVVASIPSLQRLIPTDFQAFEKALGRKGMVILTDKGRLAQVGRRA